MNIDLTHYVVNPWGDWFKDRENYTASLLRLDDPDDGVTLVGPLRVRVSVQARNNFALLGTSSLVAQTRDVFSYVLEIPPGQSWTYPSPGALIREGGDPTPPAASAASPSILRWHPWLFGANGGYVVVIRIAGPDVCADPCAPDPCKPIDPCAPRKKDCGCASECRCEEHGDELPCDFAVSNRVSLGTFFPSACEPCTPGAAIGMPMAKGPSLIVPPARGGTLRTRFFNGMFITKEDLWTDQNNNRIKHALMNRAMGQGVVWGLNVCLDGDAVCVFPGYGVDCCGNDIVISTSYRVDADALVRDPAVAKLLSQRGAHRLNLLLEYFECPEDPRPVHGDPCSPETTLCETSRIRETARLRLVPSCEVDDSGPIKDLLEVLRRQPAGPPAPPAPVPVPAPGPTTSTEPASSVPFRLRFTSAISEVVVDPKPGAALPGGVGARLQEDVKIAIEPVGASFLEGRVEQTIGAGSPRVVLPAIPAAGGAWSATVPVEPANQLVGVAYVMVSWRAKATDGSDYRGQVTIALQRPRQGDSTIVKTTVTTEASVTRAQAPPPPRFPCATEACDPEGRPRFPIPVPWLHENPGLPGEAADPKVLVLALLWALIQARGLGTPAVIAAFNQFAWKAFYGNAPFDPSFDAATAFSQLFAAWCKSLLYPGPRCECGCDPHGVIIGCAQVEGGTLQMVDPWGGRRWVVHYPLLSYWGKQFGIMPFDALASKFFDLLCCIAHSLPGPRDVGLDTASGVGAAPPTVPATPVGTGVFFVAPPEEAQARLAGMGVTVARTEALSPLAFLARVFGAVSEPRGGVRAGASVVHYTVVGMPELNFAMPSDATGRPTGPVGATRPPVPGGGRLATMVRTALAARPARSAVPPLLRDASESLTRDLLDAVAPEPATDAGRSVRDALTAAGITSVARLLDAHPEDLHVDVLNRGNAAGLAELLEVSEKSVAGVAKGVGDTLQKLAADGRIVSREDLGRPEVAAEASQTLSEALKGAVTPEVVASAVARTAGYLG
jgi:hypothetical protein